jgi:hypothetical protein
MDDSTTTELDGVTFSGARFRWEPGLYIVTLDGIDGGARVTNTAVPRGRGPGTIRADNVREDPRTITQTGFAYARSERELQERIDQLGRILAEDDETGMFVWRRQGVMRRALVQRSTFAPPRRRAGEDAIADYTLVLNAPDQRIYGVSQTTPWGASVPVKHLGGYPAPVTVEVRGNSPDGYTIIGPRGMTVVVQRPIVTGSVHRYLGDEGVLFVDGAAQTMGVTRSDPIEVPYGRWDFTVDHGCELRVTFSETWAP